MFLYNSPSWMAYALENILALKLLHDRGFNVGALGEIVGGIVGRFFNIMFGQDNVIWDEVNIKPPPEMAQMDEDSEEYFMLQEYLNRDHYDVKVKITGLGDIVKDPQAEKTLTEILQKLVPPEEEYVDGVFPWYEYFVNVSWLKEENQITGIRFHFADVIEGCCDDEAPASVLRHLKIIIEFWDQLQFEKEVQKSA